MKPLTIFLTMSLFMPHCRADLMAQNATILTTELKPQPQECDTTTVTVNEKPSATVLAYKYALGALDEYVYQPALSTFTEKSVKDMPINKICSLLEEKINQTMVTFIQVGKEAKSMQLSGSNKQDLRAKHALMAEIFYTMKPAEPMVRALYPKLNKLFDQIVELREELDYSIADTDIIVKDPTENKSILDKLLGR